MKAAAIIVGCAAGVSAHQHYASGTGVCSAASNGTWPVVCIASAKVETRCAHTTRMRQTTKEGTWRQRLVSSKVDAGKIHKE
jgi:hypothetical protein